VLFPVTDRRQTDAVDEDVSMVVVGDLSSDDVVVRVVGRMHDATDYLDGNWLTTPITIAVGRFHAELLADLRTDELQRFRRELQDVHSTLSGEATLESLDGWMTLRVRCEWNGALTVSGVANDQPGIGNRLTFQLDGLDQSHLPELIASLLNVEEAFPVIGSPT
jgi:hypothetical protein